MPRKKPDQPDQAPQAAQAPVDLESLTKSIQESLSQQFDAKLTAMTSAITQQNEVLQQQFQSAITANTPKVDIGQQFDSMYDEDPKGAIAKILQHQEQERRRFQEESARREREINERLARAAVAANPEYGQYLSVAEEIANLPIDQRAAKLKEIAENSAIDRAKLEAQGSASIASDGGTGRREPEDERVEAMQRDPQVMAHLKRSGFDDVREVLEYGNMAKRQETFRDKYRQRIEGGAE